MDHRQFRMRSVISIAALALFAAGCSAAPAPADVAAQENGERPKPSLWGSHTALSALVHLQTEIVQQELNLSAEQTEKIRLLRQSFDREAQRLSENYSMKVANGQDPPELRSQIDRKLKPGIYSQLTEILTPAQIQRWEQIAFQGIGRFLFEEPAYVDYLGLTERQSSQIERITNQLQSQQDRIGQEWDREQRKIVQALQQEDVIDRTKFASFDDYWEATETYHKQQLAPLEAKYGQKSRQAEEQALQKILGLLTEPQHRRLNELWGRKIDNVKLSAQLDRTAIDIPYEIPTDSGTVNGGNVYIR